MGRWGEALAGAAGAVANVGAQALDRQLKMQDQADAEQRAADLKIDTASRMMAAEEMMKNRAAERFAAVTQQKLGEPVVNPDPVEQTGISRESAEAAGTGSGFDMNAQDLAQLERKAQDTIANPSATAEQKQDAQLLLDQLGRQKKAQGDINLKDATANNKVRTRTTKEARDTAFEATATTDPAAYMAGQGMWKQAMETDRIDTKDAQATKDKQLDRESLERRTGMQVDQRATAAQAETERKSAADKKRDATNRARLEAKGANARQTTALMQNVAMLEARGVPKEQIDDFIFKTKDSSRAEKVFKLMLHDKFGDMSIDDAVKKVDGVESATSTKPAAGAGKIRTWNPATGKFE